LDRQVVCEDGGEDAERFWAAGCFEAKIAPDVSPKKTWSAGLCAAVLISAMSFVVRAADAGFPARNLSYRLLRLRRVQ